MTCTCVLYLLQTTEPTAVRCLVLRGLPVILGDDASNFFKSSSVSVKTIVSFTIVSPQLKVY